MVRPYRAPPAIERGLLDWIHAAMRNETQHLARVRASGVIRAATRPGEHDLDLAAGSLDSLPDCLHELVHINRLSLEDNRLTTLPDRLPPHLEVLTVARNRLLSLPESLPESLMMLVADANELAALPSRLPAGLIVLQAANNHLTALPSPLPPALEVLTVGRNSLTAVPETLPRSLRVGHFNNNQIATIPLTLTEHARHATFSFSPQHLSREALDAVDAHAAVRRLFPGEVPTLYIDGRIRRAQPFGPQVAPAIIAAHEDRPGADRAVRRLQRRDFWQRLHAEHAAAAETSTAAGQPDTGPNPVEQFCTFLIQLRHTAEFNRPGGLAALRSRVNRLLDALEPDAALRGECFAIVDAWMASCEDGHTMALDDMELAVLSHHAAAGNLSASDLLSEARSMQMLDALNTFAQDFAGPENGEAVEIALALRVQLGSNFTLPTHSHAMMYAYYANQIGVTPELVNAAREHVVNDLCDLDRRISYLADWAPWRAYLTREHPQEFAQAAAVHDAALDELQERMASLHANCESMTSDAFVRESDALQREFASLDERTGLPLRLRLTDELLRIPPP